jgi:hypothetical protein
MTVTTAAVVVFILRFKLGVLLISHVACFVRYLKNALSVTTHFSEHQHAENCHHKECDNYKEGSKEYGGAEKHSHHD